MSTATAKAKATPTMAAPESKRRKVHYIPATEEDFHKAGSEIMRKDPEGRTKTKTFQCRWMALFGVTPRTCVRVWDLLLIAPEDPLYKGVKHCHLLWCLLFLRLYGAEEEAAILCGGIDEGTYRHWSQLFIERIASSICEVVSMTISAAISSNETHICIDQFRKKIQIR